MRNASEIEPKPAPYGVVFLRVMPGSRPALQIVRRHPGGLQETEIPLTRDDACQLVRRLLDVLL